MVLADEQRIQVDVNRAYARLLERRRSELIGRPLYEFVRGGPLLTEKEWRDLMERDEFVGDAEMVLADGSTVKIHWAAHPELVTGRRLVLFVALTTYRAGRYFRRQVDHEQEAGELSERELEIIRLVAMGESGPEIAEHLHISHNTVRTHIHNAMVKTGARSRAHLVAKALGAGLVLS
jgi:DNA-binding CsgD family transcriptional regulator